MLNEIPPNGKVLFFQDIDNQALQAAYSLAPIFIFPSLAEGFGWPIIEAQACACLVITTDAPPMNEIGGDSCFYIPNLGLTDDAGVWAKNAANELIHILSMSEESRLQLTAQGQKHVKRFDTKNAIESYITLYQHILASMT